MNLAYIEDDLVDQMNFQRHLESIDSSITVVFIHNLQELQQDIHWSSFDMVFTDYWLGGIKAETFLQYVDHPDVFLITGYSVAQVMEECSYPFTGILEKPLSYDDMFRLLDWPEWSARLATPEKLHYQEQEAIINLRKSLKPEALSEFQHLFEQSAQQLLPKIRQAILDFQFPLIGAWIHQLKSNLRILGHQTLFAHGEVLEYRCYNQIQVSTLKEDLTAWTNELEKLLRDQKNGER